MCETTEARARKLLSDKTEIITRLEAEKHELAEALEDLLAEQNGPPLSSARDVMAWNAAVTRAHRALGRGGLPPAERQAVAS